MTMTARRIVKRRILIVVEIALILTVYARVISTRNNGARIIVRAGDSVVIGVFNDSDCKTPLSNIDWGLLNPGAAADVVVYLNNTGPDAATLNMTVGNWKPSEAASFLTVTWDQEGFVLNPNSIIKVNFTLRVSLSTILNGTFSFDMTINATAVTSTGKLTGDINGDGVIDLADAVLLGLAYGSKSDSPNWNAKADIQGDGLVDLSDAVLLAINYGSKL